MRPPCLSTSARGKNESSRHIPSSPSSETDPVRAGGRIGDTEFSEVVRPRRMVRHYSGRPLSLEVIERVLTSALRAPSPGFSQGWAFLALTDATDRALLAVCGRASEPAP